MTPDFPAAHSMDTQWFAVDECGHVALFDSDEGGAVPVGAQELFAIMASGKELEADLRAVLPSTQRLLVPPAHAKHVHASRFDRDAVIVFVTSRKDAEALLALPGAREEGVTRGHAVRLERLPESVARDLHDRGACDSCRSGYLDRHEADSEELREQASSYGIHLYIEGLDQARSQGIYSHWSAPASPLRASDLAEPFRARISAVTLPGCFAEHDEIVPPEHLPCRTYNDSAWFSIDGKRAGAFVGREGEYARFIACEAERLRAEGITWDPPTVPDPGPKPALEPPSTTPILSVEELIARLMAWLRRWGGGSGSGP